MAPNGFPRVFALLVGLVTACATSTRPPGLAPASSVDGRVAEEGSDAGESDEADDADGDATSPAEADAPTVEAAGPCPLHMVLVATDTTRVCVDKYEASLVEVSADGTEKPYPHWLAVDGHTVRAVSEPGVFPQGFISEVQAEDACKASSKRLCSYSEWKTACMGPSKTTFPYGDVRQSGACHDAGKSAVATVFGSRAFTDPVATKAPRRPAPSAASAKEGTKQAGRQAQAVKGHAAETGRPRATRGSAPAAQTAKTAKTNTKASAAKPTRTRAKASTRPSSVDLSVWTQLNDPRLGQVEGALARTGSHDACVNGFGVVDMVGNLHEWVKTNPAAPRGTFAGGYYLDTSLNGDGCRYRTTAHAHDYHDYSTGFRCCADAQ